MNEQLLKEQIIELTKLLELKDMRIKELEALRTIPSLHLPFQNLYSDKTSAEEQSLVQIPLCSCSCKNKCGGK